VDASSLSIDHDNLTNVTTSQHHTKYTDAEAILAVEGEATLVLDGSVTIVAGQILSIDTINEVTVDGGVTIDSVLLKDGVLEDSAYPNALLLDGTRAMTDTATMKDVIIEGATKTVRLIVTNVSGVDTLAVMNDVGTQKRNVSCEFLYSTRWYSLGNPGFFVPWADRGIKFVDQSTSVVIAEFGDGTFGEYLTIYKAGDITMLDDKMIDLGNAVSGLPAANAMNRGKIAFVEGAGGARDREYRCMKSDSDTYSWVEVANGGA